MPVCVPRCLGRPAAALALLALAVASRTAPAEPPADPTGPPAAESVGPPAPTPSATAATVQLKPGEAPQIKFDQTTHDFGRVAMGQVVEHAFTFTNTGTGPLEILNVKPSCGCTQAGTHDRVVLPGARGRIPLRVSTTNLNGPTDKSITVTSNSAEDASLVLHIKGTVWRPMECIPATVGFGRLSGAAAASSTAVRKATLKNNASVAARPKVLRSTNASFRTELSTLEEGKKYELSVSLHPPYQAGVTTGSVEIETGLADFPRLEVPVSVYLTADVEVFPNRLALPGQRKANLERQFTVINNSGRPMNITDLSCTGTALKARLEETKAGQTYRIVLSIPADYQIPAQGDAIRFKTDLEGAADMSIPITLFTSGMAAAQGAEMPTEGALSRLPANHSPQAAPAAPSPTPPPGGGL
jgi:hypothetical protein